MTEIKPQLSANGAPDSLHKILSMSISIFDSTFSLLGEAPDGGLQVPTPGQALCVRNILTCLGIGGEEEGFLA